MASPKEPSRGSFESLTKSRAGEANYCHCSLRKEAFILFLAARYSAGEQAEAEESKQVTSWDRQSIS